VATFARTWAESRQLLPRLVRNSRLMIHRASQDEQQVAEPIQVDDQAVGDRGRHRFSQFHNASFRSPAHRSSNVDRSSGLRTARQNELGERFQAGFKIIDGTFQEFNVCTANANEFELIWLRRGEFGTEHEKFVLHFSQQAFDGDGELLSAYPAENGIELIDRTVCFDSEVRFRNSWACKLSRFTRVAGFCVDFQRSPSGLLQRSLPRTRKHFVYWLPVATFARTWA
jgi:hypothetical protein